MKKAIITGATSFIGVHLMQRLLSEGWEVYAVIRQNHRELNPIFTHSNVKIIPLEMQGYSDLSKWIKEACDVYVSLAWSGTRGMQRADEHRQMENYTCSMQALEAVKNIGCKRVISAGSQAEYGPMRDKVKETDVCRPNTEYGKWKLKYYEDGMKFCKENKISFKEPRFFSLYGEGDYEQTMIQSILSNMLLNQPCELTQCIQLWDFLYIEDAVDGIFRLMDCACEDGAYNFGSGDIRPLKEYVLEMHRMTQSKSPLLFGAVPYPETGMVNVCPDIGKLQEQTGWKVKVTFEEGIRRLIDDKQKVLRI